MNVLKTLVQETNLDNINTVYVYGPNIDSNSDNLDSDNIESNNYYEPFNGYISRRDMFKYLIKFYTNYDGGENSQNMARFLAKEMLCDCSDCDGFDSVGPCEIEIEYGKHFGTISNINLV